jgi:hypothetical protein
MNLNDVMTFVLRFLIFPPLLSDKWEGRGPRNKEGVKSQDNKEGWRGERDRFWVEEVGKRERNLL